MPDISPRRPDAPGPLRSRAGRTRRSAAVGATGPVPPADDRAHLARPRGCPRRVDDRRHLGTTDVVAPPAGAVPCPCRFSVLRADIEAFASGLEDCGPPGSPRPGTQPEIAGGSERELPARSMA